MSQTQSPVMGPGLASVSYVPIVAQIRRLLVVALVSGVLYAVILHASKAYCAGGIDADGGFTDAAGNAVAAAPMCVTLTLAPSPIVYLAIAFIVLLAVSKVINKAPDLEAARHTLGRATVVIGILVLVSVVVAQLWFAFIPITEWSETGSYAFFYPFPFGSVDMTTTPMVAP
ncbi:hypothetical protein [Parafrigoribacterium soli]|uniref:hypothetical protein n=1 Tax=Parafrigoribacterium soli TaxID=3144663 RepID=UPI0032ED93C6